MNHDLTIKVKELAFRLGADLVGIASIDRYQGAPIRMSPQGILPTAKSVIVCAVHHPDAAIELDGEIHPQVMGPYRIQYIMNDKLDLPIPDKVNEKVLLDHVAKYGLRGGEFGVCLKVCLPKHLRNWDESYCKKTARRKRHVAPSDLPVHRQVYDKLLTHARTWDLDSVHFLSQDTLQTADIDITTQLPDGVSAILLTSRYQLPAGSTIDHDGSMAHIEGFDSCHKTRADALDSYGRIAQFNVDFTELDMCRELENLGYSALPKTTMDHAPVRAICGVTNTENTYVRTSLILTSAPFADLAATDLSQTEPSNDLKAQLRAAAMEKGADLFGVASAKTIDRITEQLRCIRAGEKRFLVEDKNSRMMPFDPVVKEELRTFTSATELLSDAKSVIVMGIHYPETPAACVGQPPAESVGPYVFTQYEVNRLTGHLAYSICRKLNALGYEAVYSHNLTGAGSTVGSPRGQFNDATCNALEAVAAGLGKMTLNGSVATEQYGIHQRFVAIVTNADLEADNVQSGLSEACAGCEQCLNACPTCALRKDRLTELDVAGKKVTYLPVDANRCDWATKFSLIAEEGNMYTGNFTDIPCPETVTAENLADALRQQDPVFKFRPVTGEKCIIRCPLNK